MMRALFAGVSGLRNHQARMDVIGNNIANVNTTAFKASRVTFEEAFAQLVRGASRPPGDLGGINPIQVGLGMNIGSIDQDFSQGNIESTGRSTDMAIQGDSFFVVSDGNRTFYTRAGNFQLDADGRMVSPNNGFVVQGRNADSSGEIPSGAPIEDLILPFGQKSPARATTSMRLSGNLDSREDPQGTILVTQGSVYAIEQSTTNGGAGSDINGLFAGGNADAQLVGMTPDSTTVTVSDGTTSQTYTYVETDTGAGDSAFHSLQDLIAEINSDFATMTASMDDTTGEVVFTAGGAPINLSLSSSNSVFSDAFQAVNVALAAAGVARSDEFSHVAGATDLVTNLRDGTGASLGLTAGQTILIDGNVGGNAVAQGSIGITGTTTYSEFVGEIDDTLGIVNTTGAEINATTGALRVTGDGGTTNEISGLNVRVGGGGAPVFDSVFDSQPGNYSTIQEAEDVLHALSITTFDSMGNPHVVTMTFTKDPTTANRWTWEAEVGGGATITGGSSGAVTFDSDGRLETFTFDGGGNSIQVDPNNGASTPLDISLDSGNLGDINGLSQFASPSNAIAAGQDGFPMGNLQDFSIDEFGNITGFFTNGISQTLGQVALAGFTNASGLLRSGDGMYEESGNSGAAVIGFAGVSVQSTITPGALESSNVDLSQEFTSMIVAQRGFQANARVITTADEMLSELVNIKR